MQRLRMNGSEAVTDEDINSPVVNRITLLMPNEMPPLERGCFDVLIPSGVMNMIYIKNYPRCPFKNS